MNSYGLNDQYLLPAEITTHSIPISTEQFNNLIQDANEFVNALINLTHNPEQQAEQLEELQTRWNNYPQLLTLFQGQTFIIIDEGLISAVKRIDFDLVLKAIEALIALKEEDIRTNILETWFSNKDDENLILKCLEGYTVVDKNDNFKKLYFLTDKQSKDIFKNLSQIDEDGLLKLLFLNPFVRAWLKSFKNSQFDEEMLQILLNVLKNAKDKPLKNFLTDFTEFQVLLKKLANDPKYIQLLLDRLMNRSTFSVIEYLDLFSDIHELETFRNNYQTQKRCQGEKNNALNERIQYLLEHSNNNSKKRKSEVDDDEIQSAKKPHIATTEQNVTTNFAVQSRESFFHHPNALQTLASKPSLLDLPDEILTQIFTPVTKVTEGQEPNLFSGIYQLSIVSKRLNAVALDIATHKIQELSLAELISFCRLWGPNDNKIRHCTQLYNEKHKDKISSLLNSLEENINLIIKQVKPNFVTDHFYALGIALLGRTNCEKTQSIVKMHDYLINQLLKLNINNLTLEIMKVGEKFKTYKKNVEDHMIRNMKTIIHDFSEKNKIPQNIEHVIESATEHLCNNLLRNVNNYSIRNEEYILHSIEQAIAANEGLFKEYAQEQPKLRSQTRDFLLRYTQFIRENVVQEETQLELKRCTLLQFEYLSKKIEEAQNELHYRTPEEFKKYLATLASKNEVVLSREIKKLFYYISNIKNVSQSIELLNIVMQHPKFVSSLYFEKVEVSPELILNCKGNVSDLLEVLSNNGNLSIWHKLGFAITLLKEEEKKLEKGRNNNNNNNDYNNNRFRA